MSETIPLKPLHAFYSFIIIKNSYKTSCLVWSSLVNLFHSLIYMYLNFFVNLFTWFWFQQYGKPVIVLHQFGSRIYLSKYDLLWYYLPYYIHIFLHRYIFFNWEKYIGSLLLLLIDVLFISEEEEFFYN